MRIPIRALILACACCVAAPAMHAQKQACTPPPPDSKLTPAQQKAAAAGYKIACDSVNAYNKRVAQSKSDYQLDEYIPDLYFPRMRANATLKNYVQWLRDQSGSCPNLVEQARAGLSAYPTDEGKLAFLQAIQTLVTNKGGCD
jgi:hypothetical protein